MLLVSLYADAAQRPARASVTLIDLRAADLEQTGFKVCDRIARHPSLCRATRPVIWSDIHTAANLRYARGVGAAAVIDDEWVDSGSDARWWMCCDGPGNTGRKARGGSRAARVPQRQQLRRGGGTGTQ